MKPNGRLRRRLWLIIGLLCAGGCGPATDPNGLSAVAPARAAKPYSASTVAIVLGQGERAPSPLAEPMLVEALSKFPDVQLVERQAIQRVLDELKLNASGLVDPATAIRFGKLVAADAFILIEREPVRIEGETKPRPPLTRARLIETRTGIRLLDWLSAEGQAKQGHAELVGELRRALGKLQMAESGRRYLGVIGLRSEEPGQALNPTGLALTAMVEHDLGRLPNVVVLERAQLQRLTAERDLTGIELRLRASTMILEGGLRRQGDADELSITLKLIPLAGGEAKHRRITAAAGDLGEMRRAVVRAVQAVLNVPGDDSQADDPHKEAEIFAERARCLTSHSHSRRYPINFEERRRALPFAEAALALDPTLEHHRLAYIICGRCAPLDPAQLSVESFRYKRRAHEIDLARIERSLRSPRQDEQLAAVDIMKVDHYVEYVGPGEDDKRRLLLEINALCKEKFENWLELQRRGGATPVDLTLLRLKYTCQLASSPEEFFKMMCAHMSALDREFAAGHINRDSCEQYYDHLKQQVFVNVMAPLRVRRRCSRKYRPAFEWLAKHDDPRTRLLGYYGLCELGDANVETATRLLDVLFHEIPKNQPLSAAWLFWTTREATLVLHRADKLAGYFESLLSEAEQAKDATNLARCPEATHDCATVRDPETTRDFLNRLLTLIDAQAFDPRCTEAAKELRRRCTESLAGPDRDSPPPDIGPWADYVIRPIPITDRSPDQEYLVGVCIDHSPTTATDTRQLALVWWSRRELGQARSARAELIATRMSIRGGAMREVGGCPVPPSRSPRDRFTVASMAARDEAIFVGTKERGLVMITKEAGQVFDESKGAPGARIHDLAWLDGRLYLALSGTIARFDPKQKKFTILASSKSVERRHPLDGGQLYEATSLLSDPKRHCLWISIRAAFEPTPGRTGIWRYTPATDTFQLVLEGRAERLSWSDGTLFYSTGRYFASPGATRTVGYYQFDPDSLAAKPLQGYQLRSQDVVAISNRTFRPRPGAGWVLVGSHIIAGPGWLYTPQGESYYYDPAKARLSGSQMSKLGEFDREIVGRLGRGFVIVRYRKQDPPFLWYVEPREAKGEQNATPARDR